MKLETAILKNLQYSKDYVQAVLPHLKESYFTEFDTKEYFNILKNHLNTYGEQPSYDTVKVYIENLAVNETTHTRLLKRAKLIDSKKHSKESLQWIIDQTEEFCKDRALDLAITETIKISTDHTGKISKTSIPNILAEALGVSFNTNIGHDYLEDIAERFEYYNEQAHKIPCHLDMLNRITGGGVEPKTVNCILASTGVGKSMFLCDLAANYLKRGLNVLYITLEMAEKKIAQRIDANLMDINMDEFKGITAKKWGLKTKALESLQGRLKVKEYPTSGAGALAFDYLLKEYKTLNGFVPDVVIVDYLNIAASDRFKDNSNSYGYVKSICEELRGFAVKNNVVLWTATQTNRCLSPDTLVHEKVKGIIAIKHLVEGDCVLSKDNKFNTVKDTYKNSKTKVYKIITKSGKEIVCSDNHLFPVNTLDNIQSLKQGLSIGDTLFIKEDSTDEIVDIIEMGEIETIDIELDGDRLFYANGILTHNSGADNSDIDIASTSDSFGGPMTFDFFFGLISNEELAKANQVLIKQLKNRYSDVFKDTKFAVGVDRPKMKFYDIVSTSYTNGGSTTTIPSVKNTTKNKFTGIKV